MDVAALIVARAALAGLEVRSDVASALEKYVALLATWNRRINLTALAVDPPDEAAIDRLIIEPLSAARLLAPGDRRGVDIGSGGGSPAIPMKIAAPHCRFVLVEAKERKSAFLREVIRQLALADTDVVTARAEDLAAPASPGDAADIVTIRAVRMDEAMVVAIRRQLRPGGRLLWFQSAELDRAAVPRGLEIVGAHDQLPGAASRVIVATPTT
jgi:16S rRNA (guanine527-N7)-methyltransferase